MRKINTVLRTLSPLGLSAALRQIKTEFLHEPNLPQGFLQTELG